METLGPLLMLAPALWLLWGAPWPGDKKRKRARQEARKADDRAFEQMLQDAYEYEFWRRHGRPMPYQASVDKKVDEDAYHAEVMRQLARYGDPRTRAFAQRIVDDEPRRAELDAWLDSPWYYDLLIGPKKILRFALDTIRKRL